ncbi:MAG: Fe(3+) ABC transporter substrate-binding protein [Rhodospirillales bacterium]|nr:Fe(3+) ABC transporter substrate-binding protein [Rhodospirillales bacterium]MDH3913255.1 Fe(3+) ABC transporter substrate-binding protein [Rhodospirillales bacterium]MDH3968244.1 Fe(3+) ABC transporter substrate-binding protein [Rhodospirillales bacterium]
MNIGRLPRWIAMALTTIVLGAPAQGAAQELNIYSSRHYQTDEALYNGFTEQTGIRVNRIEGKGDALIERIKSEGANSPADVLITVDAGRLWRADQAGLFQPVRSKLLEERIPPNLRHPKGHWFGFSSRARLILYNKTAVKPGEIRRYEDLADPKWRGRICIRSGANIYNQSLLGSLIAALGEAGAETWAGSVVANFARDPKGGDTDQIRSVAAGECDVGVANSYYYVRLASSKKTKDREAADAVGLVFPNQADRGTHINVSGAGVLEHAPHRDVAVRFLEYLAGAQAQSYFADGNNEYPVVGGVAPNSALQALGAFKADPVNVAIYGENQPAAQKIFDRVGWK